MLKLSSTDIYAKVCAKSLQARLTLCDTMDCSLPGSSVHGDSPGKNSGMGCHALLQRNLPNPGDQTCISYVSWIGRRVLYHHCHLGRSMIR